MALHTLGTASRFSVLKLEDDDEVVRKPANRPSKPKETEVAKKKPSKKKKTNERKGVDPELQSLAFGKPKKQSHSQNNSNNHKKEKQIPRPAVEEDEEWRKRNEEAAALLYEQDLQQAILLSKIDFEENKEHYEAVQQEAEEAKVAAKKKKKQKKDKPATMTLGEFNNRSPSKVKRLPNSNDQINGSIDEKDLRLSSLDVNFFEEVDQDAKQMLVREYKLDVKKEEIPPDITIDVRLLQLQDKLEKKDKQLDKLIKQRDKLKEENNDLKKMNAKLCSVLAVGQMKEKVDAIMQLEEMNKAKDELTQEITELFAALEQEKSKVHALQQQLLRAQGHRKDSK